MHKTLIRQIRHAIGDTPDISSELQELFESISITYDDFDKDRTLIERSLEISSTELKESISLLQATLDSTTEGILVTDEKGKMTNCNKRLSEILETHSDVLITQDMSKIVTFVSQNIFDPTSFVAYLDEIFEKKVATGNYTLRFKSGRTVEVNSKPQLLAGVNVGFVWSFRDVTMLLQAENDLRTKIDALERLNKTMIDREVKMVELKTKIKNLEEKIASQH